MPAFLCITPPSPEDSYIDCGADTDRYLRRFFFPWETIVFDKWDMLCYNKGRTNAPKGGYHMEKKIITISREFGSGGRTIGREVANRLGIPF